MGKMNINLISLTILTSPTSLMKMQKKKITEKNLSIKRKKDSTPTSTKRSDKVKEARAKQKRVQKTAKLGSGARFSALKESVEAQGKSPKAAAAIAAVAGRRAHGKKAMTRVSSAGRRRKG